jgi:hypothetical protein
MCSLHGAWTCGLAGSTVLAVRLDPEVPSPGRRAGQGHRISALQTPSRRVSLGGNDFGPDDQRTS